MANISKTTPRRLALWSATGLTLGLNTPLITFLGLMAADFSSNHRGPMAVACTATLLEGISLVLFSGLIWREANVSVPTTIAKFNRLRSRRRTDVLANSVIMTVSSAMSLVTAGWMCGLQSQLEPIANLRPMAVIVTSLVLVALVIVFESTALILLVLDSRESSSIVMLPPAEMVEARAHWSDGEGVEQPQTPSFALPPDVPEPPKTADSSTISFRSSMTCSTRPSSSKNHPGSSRPSSSSQSSQFDTWDTSTVPPPLRDTVHSRIQTFLPPIPGSRPASPAKVLDGPFLPESPHPSQVALEFPSPVAISEQFYSPPTSPLLSSPRTPLASSTSLESIPRRQFSPPPIPDSTVSLSLHHNYSTTSLAESVSHLSSRRIATVDCEENIHPLFRTSSATPPPYVTPGSVLTAASIEDALGKRRTASAEALRGRSLSERSSVAPRSSTRSRSRAATKPGADSKSEATSPLATHDTWLVPETDEPPSPQLPPIPAIPSQHRTRTVSAASATAEQSAEEPFPEYAVAATTDP